MDYMSELIEALDQYIGLEWNTSLQQSKDKSYWTLSVNELSAINESYADFMSSPLLQSPIHNQGGRTITKWAML